MHGWMDGWMEGREGGKTEEWMDKGLLCGTRIMAYFVAFGEYQECRAVQGHVL